VGQYSIGANNQVLIAPQWVTGVHWEDQTVSVQLSREAIKAAPVYDPSGTLDRQRETNLYTHYGRTPYWTVSTTPLRET
jgi:hypothetical protein